MANLKRFQIGLTHSQYTEIKSFAAERGMSVSAMIRLIVGEKLREEKKNEATS